MSETTTTVAAAAHVNSHDIVPLSTWMELVGPQQSNDENNYFERRKRESILRKTTVAYGIVKLLKNSKKLEDEEIRIDNFVVAILKKPSRSWDDIKGVGMISSGLSLMIEEPSHWSALLKGEDGDDRITGRYLSVELSSTPPQPQENSVILPPHNVLSNHSAGIDALAAVAEESNRCHLFARLLYELFTHEPFLDDAVVPDDVASSTQTHELFSAAPTTERPQKRLKSYYEYVMMSPAKGDFDMAEMPFQIQSIVRMQKLGIPASICLMTQNLLEYALRGSGRQSDDGYESLKVVGEDLHFLLLAPDRFLFDNRNQVVRDMKLPYRTEKLYGRNKEQTLIADAFCRVTRGKSEAFFIGGFSGSGKSMLVDSLKNTMNFVGAYAIKHKFDTMSRKEPLSGVISAFNQVCPMIKDTDRPVIAKKLRDEFGVDFRLLVRLLPSVSVLFPELVSPAMRMGGGEAMNARSVCFTLLRFVRVVSSPRHPVMLFLDDMQWTDSTALDVIHTILSDTMGSCMLFIGTYRDNEVQKDHEIFDLMERLEISNVRTTKVYLAGLNKDDLNTMISDVLCLYPRICKSLSDILFQTTKGNPLFVLEFMHTLQSRGLLRYNCHQKRWVWNEDIIRAENITDNVLHLLSSKMNGLSDDVQMVLKVMACFGISTNDSVVGYLSESTEYAGFRNGLEGALHDGFIVKNGEGSLQFVHDKVREAAYSLIPDIYKKQFHYHLGKVLYSLCHGKDAADTIFFIASQINYGKEWIIKDKDLSIDIAIAELNMKAGEKALDGCDHKTAYSYLRFAVSLLPENRWDSHYDLSLRLNFLTSSAANSCCLYDEAEQLLRPPGLANARCLDDQLPSYLLHCQILQAQGKVTDVYDTCSSILTELGESIPESSSFIESSEMTRETLKMYEEVGDKWLEGEITDDKTLNTTLQFYRAIALASYYFKSHSMAVYFTCKAMQLSLRKGLCEYTPITLLQFTSVAITNDNAVLCYRVAKNALSLQERFDVTAQIPEFYFHFYGRVAWRFESFQEGIVHLHQGFESGLSSGLVDMGLYCLNFRIRNTFLSGANLKSILKEIDYYLNFVKSYKSRMTNNFLLNSRETVSVLIDNGEATSINERAVFGDLNDPGNKDREAFFYHAALRCYWSGHTERCRYYNEKCMTLVGQGGKAAACIAKFFIGLNAADCLRKRRHVNISRENLRVAIAAMKEAAANSDLNFTNKLHLLEAEHQSLTSKNHRKSIDMYKASIECAKRSGFIHEQGLACEKAGFYFKNKDGNKEKAIEYFKQARECYEEWGSSMKVDFIQAELGGLDG